MCKRLLIGIVRRVESPSELNTMIRSSRPGAVTAVVCLALAAVVAAMASLNVALPDIARDTHATQTELVWVIDAYSLAFAVLLLPGGALGDRSVAKSSSPRTQGADKALPVRDRGRRDAQVCSRSSASDGTRTRDLVRVAACSAPSVVSGLLQFAHCDTPRFTLNAVATRRKEQRSGRPRPAARQCRVAWKGAAPRTGAQPAVRHTGVLTGVTQTIACRSGPFAFPAG